MGLVSAVGIHLGMQHIPILHLVSSGMQNTALLHPTPLQYLEIYISILLSSKLYQWTYESHELASKKLR